MGNQILGPKRTFVVIIFVASYVCTTYGQPCPNDCSSHGRCQHPSQTCACFEGYTAYDCSKRTCFQGPSWADVAIGIDNAHNLAECSNNGICDRSTGQCQCRVGYEGNSCERKTCPAYCNYVGQCQSMYYLATTKDVGSGVINGLASTGSGAGVGTKFQYTNIWDAYMMYGCNCDTNYFGPDCSQR